jgi:ABC-2 type transport system ATP-binding protein
MEPVIHVEGLCKDYRVGFWGRRVTVLRDLTLEIQAGETYGYLGPNGAGKSTTIKLLLGLIQFTAGSGQVLGCPIGNPISRRQIGFLPENPSFYEYLTGEEFLTYCGRLLGMPRGRLRDQVPALDPIGRKEVRDLILRQRATGRTVFFSTHILPDVEMICDRVGILVGGRLVKSGPIHELLGEELESIEVTVTSVPSALLPEMERLALSPALVQRGRVMFRLRGEVELEAALAILVGAKSRVLSVVPQRRSLEEIFLEASREAAP